MNMKLDLSEDSIRQMYYLNILNHSNNEHKNHHVFLIEITDDLCGFECVDCDEIFKSKLV